MTSWSVQQRLNGVGKIKVSRLNIELRSTMFKSHLKSQHTTTTSFCCSRRDLASGAQASCHCVTILLALLRYFVFSSSICWGSCSSRRVGGTPRDRKLSHVMWDLHWPRQWLLAVELCSCEHQIILTIPVAMATDYSYVYVHRSWLGEHGLALKQHGWAWMKLKVIKSDQSWPSQSSRGQVQWF